MILPNGKDRYIYKVIMLDLPQSTEVRKPLPKAQLYKRFGWKPSQRESFDGEVSRLDFVNWIAPRTLPAIAEGAEVKDIFVIEVSLKTRNFDMKNIVLLAKSIPQYVVYILRYEEEYRLAVYHSKLFLTDWQLISDISTLITINGLNLDAAWEGIVSSIGSFSVEQENSLSEQIKIDTDRAKIEKQIATLEKQMYASKQPRRKRELFEEIRKLKGGLL